MGAAFHVKAFPQDAVRFFDLVVKECDRDLIADILASRFDRGSVISSEKPLEEVPSVAERMPEIRASAFLWNRKHFFMTTVPMLASTGCPYDCRFCIDWNSPFRLLSMERLVEDLALLSCELPGTMMAFHDPNFGVKFDEADRQFRTFHEGRSPTLPFEARSAPLPCPTPLGPARAEGDADDPPGTRELARFHTSRGRCTIGH